MKRISYAILMGGLLAGPMLAMPILAQDNGGASEKHEGHDRSEWLNKKLGISEEQSAKLKAARKSHEDAVKPLREQLKTAMKTLHGQLKNKAADKEIQGTLDQVAKARKEMREEGEKFMAATDAILTPTQRAHFLLARAKFMRHEMKSRHGRHESHGEHGWRGDDDHGHDADRSDEDDSEGSKE